MRWIQHLWQDESGATLIFVASCILALSLFAVIAVDISKLLVTRAQLQNSADAGALAGAERFMEDPVPSQTEIEARARDVAMMNTAFNNDRSGDAESNVEDVEAVANVDEGDESFAGYGTVTVTSRSIVSQYFTNVLGLGNEGNVAALAAARAGEVCRQNCLKPWSIPDLWDDNTLIEGWPQWRNNNRYDFEDFTDLNNDGLWNPGEPYTDGRSYDKQNGQPDGNYSQEFYNPISTGYTASRNLGEQTTLKADGNPNRPEPGQYFPVVLGDYDDPNERGADRYRWNIANCNQNFFGPGDWLWLEPGAVQGPTVQGMRDLLNSDQGAYWDDGCLCVKGSEHPISPRIVFIPIHDPRIPITSGRNAIQIVKIAAFFIEQVRGKGEVTGRFVRVQAPGQFCAAGQGGGGFVYNLSLIR